MQECSPTDGKAEAPERLRHSLKVTQHAEAEMGSAFLADIPQNVSAEVLRQLFGLQRKLIIRGADQEEVGEWGESQAEPGEIWRVRGMCMKPEVL